MVLAHLLEDLDEETDLDLSGLLKQSIQGSRALSLAQDAEPLFNSAEFILEVLIERSGGHLLESGLILVDIGDPLLGQLVLRVQLGIALHLAGLRLAVKVGRRANSARGGLGAGKSGHVGRGAKAVVGADSTGRGRSQRRDIASLGGAVAVAHYVGHIEHVRDRGSGRSEVASREKASRESRLGNVTEALGSRGKAETRQTAIVQVSCCQDDRSSDELSANKAGKTLLGQRMTYVYKPPHVSSWP